MPFDRVMSRSLLNELDDGSSFVMLRGLEFGGVGVFDSRGQRSHEMLHVAVTAQLAEAILWHR